MASEQEFEQRDGLMNGPAHRRGAGINPGNRFESHRLHVLGEERDRQRAERQAEGEDPDAQRKVTREVFPDHTRQIINTVQATSDVPFDYTLNPYRGCEHGCVYCFARPYHEYLGFSSGLDFETKLVAKYEAPEMLVRELAHPRWRAEPIVMSAITDIYQPIEAELGIARQCLEVMADAGQPVSTMTKGSLVMRDVDLWAKLSSINAGRVTITLVTLDDTLAKQLEPRAASPARRLKLIRDLSAAGVDVSVNIAPVIPGLTDTEVPQILEAVADAGARRVAWVLLRLPYQLKEIFLDWLQREVHPDRARKVESLIRQARGGKLYDSGRKTKRIDDQTSRMVAQRDLEADPSRKPQGHDRRRGEGRYVEQIAQAFDLYTRKYGLNRDVRPLSRQHFRPPSVDGQMSLFG